MASLGIAITGWEAISPLGIGARAFAAPAPSGDMTTHPLHTARADFPTGIDYRPACFDVAELIGSKGIRTMDRTTALAVCTASLLHQGQAERGEAQSERTGFVIGTSTGSIRSTSDFTRDSLVQDRPFLVNPAHFPNTVMNCAAGQCGIRFKARAVNATIAGGRLSGLLSLRYASVMLRRRYADTLFTGAVEEMCPQTAWAHQMLVKQGRRHPVPLGEGCALFTLARSQDLAARGDTAVAELLALTHGRYFDPQAPEDGDPVAGTVRCIEDALASCGVAPQDVAVCCLAGGADVAGGRIEHQASARLLGPGTRLHGNDLVDAMGDTYSAGFSLALARLIVSLQQGKRQGVGIALIAGDDGHVACLVVRA